MSELLKCNYCGEISIDVKLEPPLSYTVWDAIKYEDELPLVPICSNCYTYKLVTRIPVGQETDNGVFVVTSDNQRHCVRITEVERDKHSLVLHCIFCPRQSLRLEKMMIRVYGKTLFERDYGANISEGQTLKLTWRVDF